MAGVASPLLRRRVSHGMAFLAAYAWGFALSLIVLYLGLSVLKELIVGLGSGLARPIGAGLLLGLSILDFFDLTPERRRQAEQAIAMIRRPVAAGFLFGVDIGLLFSTRKVSSLLWAGVLLCIVMPGVRIERVLLAYAVAHLIILVGSSALDPMDQRSSLRSLSRVSARSRRAIRTTSSVTLLAAGALMVAGAL